MSAPIYTDLELFSLPIMVAEIEEESLRQIRKWGVQTHTLAEWALIAGEEFGEAMKEACDLHFGYSFDSSGSVHARVRLRKELLQTVTLLLKMAEMTRP
jgi:hypothetical protein